MVRCGSLLISTPAPYRGLLQVPLHWHDSMELVYVKKGSGIVQVGVNAYPAEQGDIYIFAPGTLHALHQRGQAVMEYENIILSLELLGWCG